MSDPRLATASKDVIELLEKGLADLKERPAEKWSLNDVRALESYSKIITVCIARDSGVKAGKFADTSDEDLEKDFS